MFCGEGAQLAGLYRWSDLGACGDLGDGDRAGSQELLACSARAVFPLVNPAGRAPTGGIGQSMRIEAFGDLHETALGSAVTEDEARKLI